MYIYGIRLPKGKWLPYLLSSPELGFWHKIFVWLPTHQFSIRKGSGEVGCPVKCTKCTTIPDKNVLCESKEDLGPHYKPIFSLQNSFRKLKFVKCLHILENVT